MTTSAFNFSGYMDEFPGISVDRFEKDNFRKCIMFFLSHCHSDHMVNMAKNFEYYMSKGDRPRLYCSEESARILRRMYPNADLLERVYELRIGQTYTLDILRYKSKSYIVDVTLIPANHCFGSCMFLFQDNDDTVLYTGDFRLYKEELRNVKALNTSDGKIKWLDTIYLDTTFFKQKFSTYPTNKQSLKFITKEIDRYLDLNGDNSLVHIYRPANLGSEAVFKELHAKFGVRVHLEYDAFKLYKHIEDVYPYITNDPDDTNLHMCKLDEDGTNDCIDQGAFKVHSSAWWYDYVDSDRWVQRDYKRKKVKIAHSMHCSRKELEAFISYFRPNKAVALVSPVGYNYSEIQSELNDLVDKYS